MIETTNELLAASNRKFQAGLAEGRRNNLRLAQQIYDNFDTLLNVQLPYDERDYKATKHRVFLHDEYGTALEDRFGALARMYYNLKSPRYSGAAAYLSPNTLLIQTNTLFHTYSKHRLDYINMKCKERRIRAIWKEFLTGALAPGGELHDKQALHIVLTVPHKGGLYKGKEFYGKQLLTDFNLMRKAGTWKSNVYGGLYCLETKKGREGQGLHIHLHVACWLQPGVSVKNFREALQRLWEKQTGGAKCIWVERMYHYKKDEAGQYITEDSLPSLKGDYTAELRAVGDMYDETPVPTKSKKTKFYVYPGKTNVEDCEAAVMECIKYAFKPDTMFNGKELNFELVADMLNETQNARLYSRFGKFYRRAELAFNQNDTGADTVADADGEETTGGKVKNSIKKIVHPATGQLVDGSELEYLVIFRPETVNYFNTTSEIRAKQKQGLLPLNPKENPVDITRQNLSFEKYSGQFMLVKNDVRNIIKHLVVKQKDKLVESTPANAKFVKLFAIAHKLQHTIGRERYDEYNKFWRALPGFAAQYNAPDKDIFAQLQLAIEAMRAYLYECCRIATEIIDDAQGLPMLTTIEDFENSLETIAA